MGPLSRLRARGVCGLRAERGFTMVEIMVGIFLISVGMMAVASSFDVFQKLIGSSSKRSVASHVADQELESLGSLSYKDLVLAANPGTSSDPKSPLSGVSGSQYRPGASAALQDLVIDSTNTDALAVSRPWSEDGMSGTVYRFVTKAASSSCGTTCPKRVTVGVTISSSSGNPPDPVTASTVVAEPQDQYADETTTPPAPGAGASWTTWYGTDTQAAPPVPGVRVAPSADHAAKDTKVKPDLMLTTPPPDFDPSEPLYRYSNDAGLVGTNTLAGYPGGRILQKSGGCTNDDKNHSEWWVTNPLAQDVTLTGNIDAKIYTQILGQTAGTVVVCLTPFKVVNALKADGSFNGANTVLMSGNNCAGKAIVIESDPEAFPDGGSGPIVPRSISIGGRFLPCTTASYQIAQGQRIAIEVTIRDKYPKGDATPPLAADIPGSDAVALFDHSDYPSSIALETTAAVNP